MNILKSSKNLLIKHYDSSDLISIMIEKGEKTLRMETSISFITFDKQFSI